MWKREKTRPKKAGKSAAFLVYWVDKSGYSKEMCDSNKSQNKRIDVLRIIGHDGYILG